MRLPDDARHLVAVHLDDGILDLDLAHGTPAGSLGGIGRRGRRRRAACAKAAQSKIIAKHPERPFHAAPDPPQQALWSALPVQTRATDSRTLKDFARRCPASIPRAGWMPTARGWCVLTDDGAAAGGHRGPAPQAGEGLLGAGRGHPHARPPWSACGAAWRCRTGLRAPPRARTIPEPPGLWARDPPIRVRKAIPTAWLELGLTRGAQPPGAAHDRRVGLPTLRLVRFRAGPWAPGGLVPGQWREVPVPDSRALRRKS